MIIGDTMTLLTVKEFAERTGYDEETIRRWHRDNKINTVQVGKKGHIKIPDTELDRMFGRD